MSEEETAFRSKLIAAMVGHTLDDISKALSDALGAILAEADMPVRGLLVEEMCARLTRKAMEAQKDATGNYILDGTGAPVTEESRQGGNEKASPWHPVTPEMITAGIIELEQSTPITDRASESEMRDLVVRIFRAMQRGSLPPCGGSAASGARLD